jgi:hypothetical protein
MATLPYGYGINSGRQCIISSPARGSRSSPEEGRRGQLLRTCRACFHRKHNSIPITLGETSRAGAVDARTFACETSCARPCRLFRKQLLYQIPALPESIALLSTRNRDDASTWLLSCLLLQIPGDFLDHTNSLAPSLSWKGTTSDPPALSQ